MKIYSTPDLTTAIVLCCLGHRLHSIDKSSRRYIFQFIDSPIIHKQVDALFNGELKLDPRIVMLNSKLIKDRMYSQGGTHVV